MTPIVYRGLTWDHPRGYVALEAAAAVLDPARDGIAIHWDRQPLEGFEARPITETCARYDIIILDHPHVGEAVRHDCLIPFEEIFPADVIEDLIAASVGRSMDSYRFGDRHWALPLDAATQVMVARADRIKELPTHWDAVAMLAERETVVLPLAGPHAAVGFQAMCNAFGAQPSIDPVHFVDRVAGAEAYALMSRLAARSPAMLRDANPIAILDHMHAHDDVALCPLIYGYVNYAASGKLRFGNAPAGSGGHIGSILGGTGLGISRSADVTPALLEHLAWLVSERGQVDFIPAHKGQPGRRSAWCDARNNARSGNFYRDTLATIEAAQLRPRIDGAIGFQTDLSARLRRALRDGEAADSVFDDVDAIWRRHCTASTERIMRHDG